jgi:hypothetical protein
MRVFFDFIRRDRRHLRRKAARCSTFAPPPRRPEGLHTPRTRLSTHGTPKPTAQITVLGTRPHTTVPFRANARSLVQTPPGHRGGHYHRPARPPSQPNRTPDSPNRARARATAPGAPRGSAAAGRPASADNIARRRARRWRHRALQSHRAHPIARCCRPLASRFIRKRSHQLRAALVFRLQRAKRTRAFAWLAPLPPRPPDASVGGPAALAVTPRPGTWRQHRRGKGGARTAACTSWPAARGYPRLPHQPKPLGVAASSSCAGR